MEGMYEKLYHMLFNAYSDCLEALEDHEFAKAYSILLKAQRDCEEVYISWEEDPAPPFSRKVVISREIENHW